MLRISSLCLWHPGIAWAFSDGNAASASTRFFVDFARLNEIAWDVIKDKYWNSWPDGSRKRNAEFLLSPGVPAHFICEVFTATEDSAAIVREIVAEAGHPAKVSADPEVFFQWTTTPVLHGVSIDSDHEAALEEYLRMDEEADADLAEVYEDSELLDFENEDENEDGSD